MKKKIIFKGAASALITPFCGDEIDYGALGEIIDRQINCGIDALIVGGTTGEAATLSDSERERLYFFAMEKTDHRVPLILGTGCNDVKRALDRTRLANRVGCDGILVVTPYYNKGTENGIYKHYMTLSEASDIPMILYNVPSRTGVNLGFNLLSRLGEHPNIVAIKEASDSIDRLVTLSSLKDSLCLYAGNDSQIYPVLALGGVGVISVVSNILPSAIKDLCRNYFDGKQKESLEMQLKLLPLITALFTETNPSPVKYAMSRLGYCSDEVRLPLDSPRDSTKAQIDVRLDELREFIK